ncbi:MULTISPECIES: hypothetical protein [Gallibacterium]|uniref:Uncharacterized protein n=2 Tax=Gallibacterium TaxID=155493 RepID=A0A1A7P3Y0_9PAST|nr:MULTISPECIES: hypothetical protein [Gallibacterium]KGQ26818.1 hypothetical protein JP27_06635 [Gallibacterium anatis]KGQ36691.1 hypothetical protein JP36_09030 [Gallibacterium genomosp. 1]OBW97162.1 hypothetical protein QV02_01550 [Gallibacterium anatis]OBW99314.1 hypothetical protein QV03_03835 [Gallibacterium anatis]
MEILIFFIGAFIWLGLLVAGTVFALGITVILVSALIMLAIRFWYISLAAMLIMLFPVLYLEGWLGWTFVTIIVFAIAIWFIPVPDDQKADYKKAKAEFKASWNDLISKP